MLDKEKSKAQLVVELIRLRRETSSLKEMKVFRKMVESGREGIIISDDQGNHLYANKAAAEITDYSVGQLVRMGMKDLVHPEISTVFGEKLKRKISDEPIPTNEQVKIIRKDGTITTISASGVRIDWHGKPAVFIIFQDITEKLRLEENLVESELRFQRIFDEAPIGIAVISLDTRFLRVNKALCNLLGYTESEFFELTIRDISHPDHISSDARNVILMKKGQIEEYETEKRYLRKDGLAVWCRLSLRMVRGLDGKPLYLVPMIIDITRSKKAEEMLLEKERLLAEKNFLLENKNIALREVMEQVKAERDRAQKQVLSNVDQLLMPLVARMKLKNKDGRVDPSTLELLEDNIKSLTSGFGLTVSDAALALTKREIEVCNMIRNGFSSKEIAQMLGISVRGVGSHRRNIRKKLGATKKTINMMTLLNSK
jgi:PAS domain S-box-containing protein